MRIATTKKKIVTLNWSSKDSPLWGILKVVVSTLCVASLLWMFADHFDTGEVKAIVLFFLGSAVTEGVNVRTKANEAFRAAMKGGSDRE